MIPGYITTNAPALLIAVPLLGAFLPDRKSVV